MRNAIKALLQELLPELSGGLHLDRYARVLAAADQPGEGSTCERFRPRYAVDVEILGPDMEPDKNFPRYNAVPLPVGMGAGLESGSFSFPEPGTLCVIGFAYGRPDHPVIRQLYPLGASLPAVAPGEILLQKSGTVFQRADAGGNWTRETDAGITDVSLNRTVRALEARTEYSREERDISEHSAERVGSTKVMEAGTVLTLLAGLRADMGSLGTLNLSAGTDSTASTAGMATETVGKDHKSTVKGNRNISVQGSRSLKVQGNDDNTVQGNQATSIQGKGTITAQGKLLLESAEEVVIRAPRVVIEGMLITRGHRGGAGESTLYGSFTVLQGGIAVPDNDVTAGAVSLRGHVHSGVQGGGGNTNTPVGG